MPPLRSLLDRIVTGAALAATGVSALGATLGQGGRFSIWLDAASHGAPVWLAGGFIGWLLAFLAPRGFHRRLSQTLGVLAVLCAAPLMAPELLTRRSPPAPADVPHQLRIVQLNVWDLNGDLPSTVAWLAAARPDVITMAEPDRDALNTLRRRAGYHVVCQEGLPQWCRAAILSLAPPLASGIDEASLPGDPMPLTRAVFAAPGGGRFTVIAAHFTWPTDAARQAGQRRRLAGLVARSGDRSRLIIGGDFNSTPWSFARRRDDRALGLERRTRALFSWPTPDLKLAGIGWPFALLPIDHLYAGSAWRTVRVVRGPAIGSDHFPIVATLALAARGEGR